MLRFNKDVYTVKSGGTVKFKLTADQEGPHTLSIVRAKDLPKTAKQVNNCSACNGLTAAREKLERVCRSTSRIVELRVEGHDVAAIAQMTGRAKRSVERILQEFRERLSAEVRDDA